MSLYEGLGTNIPLEAQTETETRDTAATSNVQDLRRARQRARTAMRELTDVIVEVLAARELAQLADPNTAPERRINQLVSRTAGQHIRRELLDWLQERKRITMGRAARAAFDEMQRVLPEGAGRDDLVGNPSFTNADTDLLNLMRQIDVGLLLDTEVAQRVGATSQPLAEELGDDVTRQLRVGVSRGEPIVSSDPDRTDLRTRVDMVLNGPDYARERKQEAGITGQAKRTKAELIAHDSVQDAHNAMARRRYLQNGFRFVVYDATCDTKTTDLCRRLGECNGPPVVIDLVEDPWLVPPNHPFCRSGVRPVLEPPREPITEDRIANDFLQLIWSTEGFRPTVQDDQAFQPTALTRQLEQGA